MSQNLNKCFSGVAAAQTLLLFVAWVLVCGLNIVPSFAQDLDLKHEYENHESDEQQPQGSPQPVEIRPSHIAR